MHTSIICLNFTDAQSHTRVNHSTSNCFAWPMTEGKQCALNKTVQTSTSNT